MEEVITNFKNTKNLERKRFSGKLDEINISPDYIDSITNSINEEEKASIKESNLKVVVDPNGGTAALVIKDMLER
jgi:phosphomannomutase